VGSPLMHALRAIRGNTVLRVGLAILGAVIVLACGATPTPLKTAPARDLQLSFEMVGAYTSADGLVQMKVYVSDPSKGGLVALSGSQRLTCDGVSGDMQGAGGGWWTAYFALPRQPSGGAYTCVYTDERGQQTTATIAMPPGRFAITSPAAGAHVPIPGPLGLKATVTPSPNQAHDPAWLDQPLVIHYVFPRLSGYVPPPSGQSVTPPPQGPYAIVGADAGCGDIPPTPVLCPPVHGSGQSPTGIYYLSDAAYASGQGFDQIVPGPGYIYFSLGMHWSAPAGGFRSIVVESEDVATVPIVWTAGAGSR
jgi:hypothetical protein